MSKKITDLIRQIKINEKTINYILILILGFLVGVAVKTEAKNRITIGFNDYKLQGMKQGFDLTKPSPSDQQNQAQPDQGQPQPTSDQQQPADQIPSQ